MSHGMIGAHHQAYRKYSDEWLTPPRILLHMNAPASFDLDPAAPEVRPWNTAKQHFTMKDNGLAAEWRGRVWLNPPYGGQLPKWMRRIALHCNGIALVFARTETEWFQEYVWKAASALLFIHGRLNFFDINGGESPHNAGAPSVLIAFDREFPCRNAEALRRAAPGIGGTFVRLEPEFIEAAGQ